MKNLWPLLLLVVAVVVWNRSCGGLPQQARPGGAGARVAESHAGGPVRQLEHAPSDIMDMQNAMPSAGGGGSTKAMLDTARGAQN